MMALRTLIAASFVALLATVAFCEDSGDPVLRYPDGSSASFSAWCKENGPAALLLWASWSPDGQPALQQAAAIQKAASQKGLSFSVVAMQEPLESAQKALEPRKLPWLYDRHGFLLKKLLIYEVPTLVVVSKEGTALTTGPVTPSTILEWTAQ